MTNDDHEHNDHVANDNDWLHQVFKEGDIDTDADDYNHKDNDSNGDDGCLWSKEV